MMSIRSTIHKIAYDHLVRVTTEDAATDLADAITNEVTWALVNAIKRDEYHEAGVRALRRSATSTEE